jgi:hypothetical protein
MFQLDEGIRKREDRINTLIAKEQTSKGRCKR